MSVVPNWDAGDKGKHGGLGNPDCWMYCAADCGGIETGLECKTGSWPSLTRFRHCVVHEAPLSSLFPIPAPLPSLARG